MTRVRTMRRMPLVRDVPRLVLVLLVLASAAPTGCCAGAEEWVPTTKPSSSQPWFTGPDDPPAGDTEPTDIERELFHTRTTSCAVCQRAVMYLDEHLLVRILDERARSISPNDPANYGRLETIVEDKIGKVCSASGIQLDKKARNACDDMLARFETQLVKAWYERSVQDDDWNMNWRICAKKHGMLKVCPLEISRFDVPTLDHLEQELKIEELRAPIKVDTETGRTQPRYQSQPTPVGRAEIARAGSGKMNVLTGRDFVHRVIAEENTDHLVYFGYPNKYPRVHKATMRVLTRVAGAFKDPGVKKHHVAMSALDLERNEVPHPYGSHVKGPTVILYPADGKHAPRLLPLRGDPKVNDDPEFAPTLADVLALFHRRAGNEYTRDKAGKAFVDADQGELEGEGREDLHDEL